MKIKIDILRWDTGELIYSYECEENTIKITLERGVNEKIDFFRAELNWAELNGAKLNGAKLNWAKLNGAELNGAKLNRAELNWAKLNGAELNRAELNWAKLNGAELNWAELNRAELNWAELNWAELDFSSWGLSCNTLNTLLDQRLIVQLLFHAAKPCENNKIKIDADVRRLFKSKIFIKILQKFHRQDVKEYTGNLK